MPNIGDILPKSYSIESMMPEGVHIRGGHDDNTVDFYPWSLVNYIISRKATFEDYRCNHYIANIAEARAYLRANPTNRIRAIKMVRDLLKCSLKDAKDIVEGWC